LSTVQNELRKLFAENLSKTCRKLDLSGLLEKSVN
jgi:hypothetical protein